MRALVRVLIAALVLIGVGNLIAAFSRQDTGTYGFDVSLFSGDVVHVGAVAPGSAAGKAGIHTGDQLRVAPTFENRIKIVSTEPGDTATFFKDGKPVELTAATDTRTSPLALIVVATASKLAFLFMAALIAWRRSQDGGALALALFLATFGVAIDFDVTTLSPIAMRLASSLLVQLSFMLGAVSVLTFACVFPSRADRGIRKMLLRFALPGGIIGAAATMASFTAKYVAGNQPATTVFGSIYLYNYLLMIVATMTALVSSYRESEREARARMRWVLGIFAFGFSGLVALFIALALRIQADWSQFIALTMLAIPFGLAYVILRHRVIDIGFVINRAVVYTGVSVVVVGLFIVFEWLLGHIVEENSRASTLLALGGALALGLSARFIHARVDRWVDDLFFRDRHQAEAAIRRFAHEAGMITDPDVLVTRTVDVATRNARVGGATFYARLHDRYVPLHTSFASPPVELDENDEAVLEMRTFHEPVDVHEGSAVHGYAAFPMMVRGQLAGFLVCGEKTTHEAFAPDERDALRILARDAGIALDSLRVSRIEHELGFLAGDGELPAPVRMRLASLLSSGDDLHRQRARSG